MSLEGFAEVMAGNDALRQRLLTTDSLLVWPSSDLVGVTKNVNSQRMNSELLKLVAEFWCPQWEQPVMVPVDELKLQAGLLCFRTF